jgi:hypothetical protein
MRNQLTPYNSSPHDIKANTSIDTKIDYNDISGYPNRDQRDNSNYNSNSNRGPHMAESQFTSSPSVIKTFTVESPIRALEEEKNKVTLENQKLFRRIK